MDSILEKIKANPDAEVIYVTAEEFEDAVKRCAYLDLPPSPPVVFESTRIETGFFSGSYESKKQYDYRDPEYLKRKEEWVQRMTRPGELTFMGPRRSHKLVIA